MPPTEPADYSITHNIPVADHVYKYLRTRCGTDHLVASRNNTFGNLILSLQTRNPDVKPKKTAYTRVFQVTVREDSYRRKGMFVTSENAQLFNDQVDRMFREELFFHVVINKGNDNEMYLNSIRKFLQVYDITEEDIKLDSLYRDFKRRKETYEHQLNFTSATG